MHVHGAGFCSRSQSTVSCGPRPLFSTTARRRACRCPSVAGFHVVDPADRPCGPPRRAPGSRRVQDQVAPTVAIRQRCSTGPGSAGCAAARCSSRPRLISGHVQQVLAGRGALEPPRGPVGAARGLVGQDDPDPAPVGGHPVGPGQHGHGQLGHRDPVSAAVGAVVVRDVVGQGQDRAVCVEGGGDAVVLLAGVVDRDQVLGSVRPT